MYGGAVSLFLLEKKGARRADLASGLPPVSVASAAPTAGPQSCQADRAVASPRRSAASRRTPQNYRAESPVGAELAQMVSSFATTSSALAVLGSVIASTLVVGAGGGCSSVFSAASAATLSSPTAVSWNGELRGVGFHRPALIALESAAAAPTAKSPPAGTNQGQTQFVPMTRRPCATRSHSRASCSPSVPARMSDQDEWVEVEAHETAPLTPRDTVPEPVAAVSNTVSFKLNGRDVTVKQPDPTRSLLDYLRYDVGLTGTKGSCRQGGCGACTVMMNGLGVNACLRPLVACDGMTITTTEGVGNLRDGYSSVQDAIAKGNGSQCGFCTPVSLRTAPACLTYIALYSNWPSLLPHVRLIRGIPTGNGHEYALAARDQARSDSCGCREAVRRQHLPLHWIPAHPVRLPQARSGAGA
jgi:aerobic-type carbon monoxide dehydrogenase small subunit (CoxS/CutS family)